MAPFGTRGVSGLLLITGEKYANNPEVGKRDEGCERIGVMAALRLLIVAAWSHPPPGNEGVKVNVQLRCVTSLL